MITGASSFWSAEQVIGKLREAEVLLSQGSTWVKSALSSELRSRLISDPPQPGWSLSTLFDAVSFRQNTWDDIIC